MRRLALVGFALLALFVALGSVSGQDDPPPDIGTLTPADLLPGDARPALARAGAAYAEERYEDAIREYAAAIRTNPTDANSIYNLACCYGLLDMPEQAAAFLEAAFAAGFRDLGHARGDPDFDLVREHEAFASAMERMTERAAARVAAAGEFRTIRAETLMEYRVVEPEGERSPWERLPLLVALHGYGDNAENFAGLFAHRGMEAPFLFVAIRAPYAFSSGPRGLGYSWSIESDRAADGNASAELSEELVLQVIDAVKREYRVDERRVYLMGFSQGAGMAFRVGLRNPDGFAGVIPVGGWLESGAHPDDVMDGASGTEFLVCHSPEDRIVPFESATAAAADLADYGIPHELVEYRGGHSLPADLLERIVDFLDLPEPEEGPVGDD